MKDSRNVINQQLKSWQTAAGSASTTSTSTPENRGRASAGAGKKAHSEADIYDAVNYAFTLMRDAYPQQFLTAFPNEQSRSLSLIHI